MTYALYYAGMANDRVTEQIGIAISEDGCHFARVGDGLLVPASADHPWKSLRTCNPTVVKGPDGYVMFYQGISQDQEICIAAGHSADGVEWTFDDEPLLTVQTFAAELEADERGLVGLIEPAVLVRDDGFHMWLISRGSNEVGNRLHYVHSVDGKSWSIRGVGLLSGSFFGSGCLIHYPQIMEEGGVYTLDISVRSKDGSFTVMRGHSKDGSTFGDWNNTVPSAYRRGFCHRVSRKLLRRAERYALGLAHSHVVEGETSRTYYHAYHLNAEGRAYMDVVFYDESVQSPKVQVAFSPAKGDLWDSFFVADPFIAKLG